MNNRPIIIQQKSESTFVKLVKIAALVWASPWICLFSLIAMVTILGTVALLVGAGVAVHDIAPWLLGFFLLCGLLPAVTERVSRKNEVQQLKDRVRMLELELSESRLEMLKLHETAEFHKKLNETKTL